MFDQDLSFKLHIKQVSRVAFMYLCIVSKIRNILSQSDAEKLIHAFVTSRLEYWDVIFSGCPFNSVKMLQFIQNAPPRVLIGTASRGSITPVLASLQ